MIKGIAPSAWHPKSLLGSTREAPAPYSVSSIESGSHGCLPNTASISKNRQALVRSGEIPILLLQYGTCRRQGGCRNRDHKSGWALTPGFLPDVLPIPVVGCCRNISLNAKVSAAQLVFASTGSLVHSRHGGRWRLWSLISYSSPSLPKLQVLARSHGIVI